MSPLSQHASHAHDPMQGIVLKLLSVLLFAFMALQIKLLEGSYHTSEVIFARSFFALFTLLPLLAAAGGTAILKPSSPKGILIRSVAGMMAMTLSFYSLPHVPLATFTAIQFTMPLFVVILASLFLKERLTGTRLGAVLLGFVGVLIILRPASGGYDFYALVTLGAAFGVATVTVILRQLTATENSISIVFWFTLFCTCVSGLWLLTEYRQPSLHDALLLIGSGLSGGAGQVLLTQAYRFGQVSMLTAFEYTGIIWATGFELLFWHRIPDLQVFIGTAIIIGTGLYLLRHATQAVKDAAPSSASGKPC